MRITYQNGKIRMSFTKMDMEEINKSGTMPMEISVGQFKVLLEDINAVNLEVWKKQVMKEVGCYTK